MHSNIIQHKAAIMRPQPDHQGLTLDRRSWLFLASLAGALFACITPLPF